MNNKKGNFKDIPEWIYFALTFSILVVLASNILASVSTNINSQPDDIIDPIAKGGAASLSTAFTQYYDWAFPVVYMIFLVFSIVMARLIPSSPKFIAIAVLYLLSLPFAAMFVVNVWSGFATNPALLTTIANLTFIPYMMDKLVYFVLFYVGGVSIALYTKDN